MGVEVVEGGRRSERVPAVQDVVQMLVPVLVPLLVLVLVPVPVQG